MAALEADIVQQLYAVKLNSPDDHSRLVTALQVSRAVGRHLWHLIQDGAAVEADLNLRGKRID